ERIRQGAHRAADRLHQGNRGRDVFHAPQVRGQADLPHHDCPAVSLRAADLRADSRCNAWAAVQRHFPPLMPDFGPIVETEKLTHTYGLRVALHELSLRVHAGEAFALLGPNGSGKTTLFRILSTLIPPMDGVARVLGH